VSITTAKNGVEPHPQPRENAGARYRNGVERERRNTFRETSHIVKTGPTKRETMRTIRPNTLNRIPFIAHADLRTRSDSENSAISFASER
jgi:hypothetical protein